MGRPGYTQGYTLGLQWARQLASEGVFRLQSELTYLEQTSRTSPTNGYHLVRSFYTSASIPQGYTHRGQSLGAAIGPGSSSQWNAADYLKARWQLGAFVGRVRWDTDAFHNTVRARERAWPFLGHDVSVFGGLRGGYALLGFRIDAELTTGTRYNFLFQNRAHSWETAADSAVDVRNRTFRLNTGGHLTCRTAPGLPSRRPAPSPSGDGRRPGPPASAGERSGR
ncbi:MAG: hypothetical protein M3P24_10310 [Gemmatimonadota bacterium]|nr:hypothetical protein [Gemmatimonadota bacterium]